MTPSQLASLIAYDPETGALTWLPRGRANFDGRFVGKPALSQRSDGYLTGRVGREQVKAHRAAWAIYHGVWPTGQIDHINGNRSDNRIVNLRDVDNATNSKNQRPHVGNTSGHTGISWFARDSKWWVKITVNMQAKHIGYFDSLEDAIAARDAAYKEHGFHENHGRILSALDIGEPLQQRVALWMEACFGPEISNDRLERGDRLLEEVLELLQSGDYPKERIAALTDYTYGREKGDPVQEAGGVMITLAAYCLAHGLDMHAAGETELARVWTKIDKIRAKHAAKPTGSALPIASPSPPALDGAGRDAVLEEIAKQFDQKARTAAGDIFVTTTTRSEICRAVAAEIRSLKETP